MTRDQRSGRVEPSMGSPGAEGFRMPSDARTRGACWVAWPHLTEEWGVDLEPARRELLSLCAAILDRDPRTGAARGETLRMLVYDERAEAEARRALGDLPVALCRMRYGDIWMRDMGPLFVVDDAGAVASCAFRWSGWGGKYLFEHDAAVAEGVAARAAGRRFSFDWVLEGGSVDTDGEGTLLTTRRCLLDPRRNPGLDEAELERRLRGALGVERVLWLDACLANDHTDGHVDTLARFVAAGVVLCMEPSGASDPNREALRSVARTLAVARDARGRRLALLRVPSPGAVTGDDGALLPASYMNYYVGNRAVIVPTYGTRWDDEAVRAVACAFPDRPTVGLPARALLTGGGAFHCVTREQPADGRAPAVQGAP